MPGYKRRGFRRRAPKKYKTTKRTRFTRAKRTRRAKPAIRGDAVVRATAHTRNVRKKAIAWRTQNGEIPQQLRMKLAFTPALLERAPGVYYDLVSYRSNSIYDPDATAGAAKPSLYDVLNTLYTTYHVHAASIRVQMRNLQAEPLVCGILASDDLLTGATFSANPEMVMQRCHRLMTLREAGRDGDTGEMVLYAKTKDLLRRGASTNEATAFGSNPADVTYFMVCAVSQDSVALCLYDLTVSMTFYTELDQPKWGRSTEA